MLDIEQTKQKIISIIKTAGPTLPIRIAKQIELSPVFTSAILSELVNEQRIKTSNLKIGSSPLYFSPEQEQKLELFTDNLKGYEKTAFLRLKEKKILEDGKQEPAIRVALRSIRDFAIPIKFQDKIFWKYYLTQNSEIQNLFHEKPIEQTKPKQETTLEQRQKQETTLEQRQKQETQKEKPLLEIKQSKQQRQKKTSETQKKFYEEIKSYLIKKDIELLNEIEKGKKEFIALIRINSDLGKITLLLIAKDKKRITKTDLTLAYQKTIDLKSPCLFLSRAELPKSAIEFMENYKNMIKVEKFE